MQKVDKCETHPCTKNGRHRVSNYYGLARLVLARLFRRKNSGLQNIQNPLNYIQSHGGWKNPPKGVQVNSNAELIKAIDEGWRYFWKQRGYDHPPSADLNTFTFGNEKNKAKVSKQKKTERTKGIQKAGREFSEGQGL